MSRQAQVGLFALGALVLLFGVFFVITDFGTRQTGYKIGVRFQSAAGLHSGALVYFSGVTAGTVDEISLLPDASVEVILSMNRRIDIPRDSRFLIQAPITGDPSVVIVPPRPQIGAPVAVQPPALLPRTVLPIDQQPIGHNSASVADLLDQGQGEIRRFDILLADISRREPRLLDALQSSIENANSLTRNANMSMTRLSSQLTELTSVLQTNLSTASGNVADLTSTLDQTVVRNQAHLNNIVAQLDRTSVSLDKSMESLQALATDPALKSSVVATAKNVAETTQTISELTHDLRSVTGNPQTQAQMRDTIANLDAASQRANSLLGAFGGTSSVYGVDTGATPAPIVVPSTSPYPMPAGAAPTPQPRTARARTRPRSVAGNFVIVHYRATGLARQRVCCGTPLLSSDRGPQSDFYAILLPRSPTRVLIGVNDIGANTTWNLAAIRGRAHGFGLGGGILYSRPGVLARYGGALSVQTLFYDPRRPTLDLYGNIRIAPAATLFFGQRSLNHQDRRTVYGIDLGL